MQDGGEQAHKTHAEWKCIHCAALHASWVSLVHSSLEHIWGHPVVQLPTGPTRQKRHCVLLQKNNNHHPAFYLCHILRVCVGQRAVLILGELLEKTLLFQQAQCGSVLNLSSLTNVDALWLAQMITVLSKSLTPTGSWLRSPLNTHRVWMLQHCDQHQDLSLFQLYRRPRRNIAAMAPGLTLWDGHRNQCSQGDKEGREGRRVTRLEGVEVPMTESYEIYLIEQVFPILI